VTVESQSGRHVRSAPWRSGAAVDVSATLRAACLRLSLAPDGCPRRLQLCDLRRKVRLSPERPLVVLVVDTSESMQAQSRMASVRSSALGLLARTHLTRDRVAVVAFGGETAHVALQPTSSMALARERLLLLQPDGATPLAAGLYAAWQLVRSERVRDPSLRACLVLLSDGEANVPIAPGLHLVSELAAVARLIRKARIPCLVVEPTAGTERSALLVRLQGWLMP
jgi:magnesium chelatase subunit D